MEAAPEYAINTTEKFLEAYSKRNENEQMILEMMFKELVKADTKYVNDRMSPEEIKCSLLTLKCEVMELEREVERKNIRMEHLRKEAIQSLAMPYKFCCDVAFADWMKDVW